jgi:hypothetical protein
MEKNRALQGKALASHKTRGIHCPKAFQLPFIAELDTLKEQYKRREFEIMQQHEALQVERQKTFQKFEEEMQHQRWVNQVLEFNLVSKCDRRYCLPLVDRLRNIC